jgi:hypothetical protein
VRVAVCGWGWGVCAVGSAEEGGGGLRADLGFLVAREGWGREYVVVIRVC